jgi:hypothetical protein
MLHYPICRQRERERAAVGTMAGGRQARQNKRAAGEEAKTEQAQTLNTYDRAFGACMEGRGYTIK